MSADSKTIRLVTALVECRPDGEYVPWGIKWYDGAVYLFKEIESYTPRSWAMGNDHVCESWRVVLKNDTAREICHYKNSWYVVHDPQDDQPGIAPPKRAPSELHTLPELAYFTWRCFFSHCTEVRYSMPSISIMAAHLQTFRNVTFEIYPHIAAFAAVRVLARALKHAPRRLHRIGSAVNLIGQAFETNP